MLPFYQRGTLLEEICAFSKKRKNFRLRGSVGFPQLQQNLKKKYQFHVNLFGIKNRFIENCRNKSLIQGQILERLDF